MLQIYTAMEVSFCTARGNLKHMCKLSLSRINYQIKDASY